MSEPGQFDYINRTYGLNVKRGTRVEYTGCEPSKFGTVTSAEGQYINIRFDDAPTKRAGGPFHPTWKIRYVDAALTAKDRAQ